MSVPSSVLFVQRNANSNFVFRDDPVWEDWYEDAHGVQGGLEDSGSSSESEDEIAQPVILPTTCICKHCRLVLSCSSVPDLDCFMLYFMIYFKVCKSQKKGSANPQRAFLTPGSVIRYGKGMEKIRIRDGKNSDPGSGMEIILIRVRIRNTEY